MTDLPILQHFPDFARLPRGPRNAITDVPGVAVGHRTLRDGDVNTGVTAVLPHGGNLFRRKVVAGARVINGFGKTVGLPQLQELGQIETPILLTNTLSVPACAEALIRHAIAANPGIGRSTSTVNPLVGECNDGPLNDIQRLALRPGDALAAIAAASGGPVAQGSLGAGTGMTCFGFKGGVGSASRRVDAGDEVFTLGGLVVSNFGRPGDLLLPDGRRLGPGEAEAAEERGSVMIVLATDAPLDARQLGRVAARAGAGLARLGSFWGNGSGDFAIAFSTAHPVAHDAAAATEPTRRFAEARIDGFFEAAAELTQEAVLNSMLLAGAFTGFRGRRRESLADRLAGPAGR